MDKRIVLASAGSGKTYYIANSFSDDDRVFLITFTNQNANNIREEIKKRYLGNIPENVKISTFDSFVYNHLIRPFEPISIFPELRSKGVEVNISPETNPRNFNSYISNDKLGHYVINDKFYVLRLSKFFMKQTEYFKNTALKRLKDFCDSVYIDEFQDYNGWDFKLMKYLLESASVNVISVGDIYQSLVTTIRSDGNGSNKPFSNISSVQDLKAKFISEVKIDKQTLLKSRRVCSDVCNFINTNLGIPIESASEENGGVNIIEDLNELSNILADSSIIKLIWNKTVKCDGMINCVNWSYSKGDTYSKICVILTNQTDDLSNWNNLKPKVRNMLYVALTRSTGVVYLVKSSVFKTWKKSR